jgi:hypothetical protein
MKKKQKIVINSKNDFENELMKSKTKLELELCKYRIRVIIKVKPI